MPVRVYYTFFAFIFHFLCFFGFRIKKPSERLLRIVGSPSPVALLHALLQVRPSYVAICFVVSYFYCNFAGSPFTIKRGKKSYYNYIGVTIQTNE